MEKVKIFVGAGGADHLERSINEWLEEAGDIEITHVLQNSCDRYGLTITFFYKMD
jgi:hypothetical protein